MLIPFNKAAPADLWSSWGLIALLKGNPDSRRTGLLISLYILTFFSEHLITDFPPTSPAAPLLRLR